MTEWLESICWPSIYWPHLPFGDRKDSIRFSDTSDCGQRRKSVSRANAVYQNFPWSQKCSISVLSNMAVTTHRCLVSVQNGTRVTEDLILNFYLISINLNSSSYMRLAATILYSAALKHMARARKGVNDQKCDKWTAKYLSPESQAMGLASPPLSYMILDKALFS